MSNRRHKPRIPYLLQPRRMQKAAYIGVKNRIRRAAPILGGKFITPCYMHGENGWLDAYFLGRKAPIFYNLDIQTASYAYKEAVEDSAWSLSYERAPERDPLFVDRAVKNPRTGMYDVPPREPVKYPELDGLTRLEWTQVQYQVIADRGEIKVFEEWRLREDYSYGIGLHATIDVPFLTIDALNSFIDRFLAAEADYRNPVPLTCQYDQITHWGLESNALIDPWDWAAVKE